MEKLNCKFCEKECKNKISLAKHECLCKLNPNKQESSFVKYNANATHKAWNKGLTKETDERVAKYVNALKERFLSGNLSSSFKGKHHTEKAKQLISQAATINNLKRLGTKSGRGKRGYYKGFYCQSSWELAYVIYNLEHNINFKRNKTYFNYTYEGKQRHYFPDFYLPDTDTYVEVKGYYDKLSKIKAEQFKGNLLVLKQLEIKPYLQYCINKYGNDFYKLYDIID